MSFLSSEHSSTFSVSAHARSRYQEILQRYMDDLGPAVETFNWEKIQWITHKIQGSAALFGYAQLGVLAKNLQSSAKATDFEGTRDAFQEIAKYFSQHFAKLPEH